MNKKFKKLTSYKLQATSYTSRGFTLFYAVLVTSLLLALGLAVFNITLKELRLSSDARESQNSFYAADTALECVLYWDLSYDGLSSPAFGFYGDSLSSGITNYWRFDEGSGGSAGDTGSADNNGLLLDSGSEGPAWSSGYINDALTFDGIDDYVGLEETSTYTGEFTISVWARPILSTVTQLILGGSDGKFGFSYNSESFGTEIRLSINGVVSDYAMSTPLGFGWNNIIVRRDQGDDVDIIINNTLPINAGTHSGSFDVSFIGKSPKDVDYYHGDIDDVRIYNRALSDKEIEALFGGIPSNIFVNPVEQMSGALCAGADITDPTTGWAEDETGNPTGWDVVTGASSAETTFDLLFDNGRCASVVVTKNTASTTIVARGYNTCEITDPRRLERALRAEY